ncbi:LRC14 protein, partial [Copsychus sechellarum]|nr:LRC14 protein [Copsychus sechellarum]
MDSLLFLCARRVVAKRPLPALPSHLYHVVFQAAFQDGRPLVLQDLVATWPFPELHFLRLVEHLELRWDHPFKDCVQAVIHAVVEQLRQELEQPDSHSRCRLRVLDMMGVLDDPDERSFCSITKALATACVEVSKHQQEFQTHRPKRHKGCSGVTTAAAAPQPPGVDVHTDLLGHRTYYEILRDALQIGATGLLRLRCREFEAQNISASEIVTLLDSLDPSFLRRVELCFSLELAELSVILPHLSRFPELRSLKLQNSTEDVQDLIPESAMRIRCVARQLGMLSSLRELSLRSTHLSGNLHQILCDLQAPLESLGFASCFLVPADLTFLSQSIHAPALKRLDLRGLDVSEGLLEPLQLLLEKTSASLLYLNLMGCCMADSHLNALLPTLLRCSRLRFLGLYHNPLSKAAIKDLLQKTLELLDLQKVVYPIPMDCREPDPSEFLWDFYGVFTDEQLLSAAEAEISQLLVNSGRTDLDWTWDSDSHAALDYFSL